MANLIIDIGNTAIKACWSDGMTLGKTHRYQGEHVVDFILSLLDKTKPDITVVSCAYSISREDESLLRKYCGDNIMILDPSHKDYLARKGLPSYITYDRAAALLASKYLFKGHGCTVVDLGTTLTVDFLDSEGGYLGGNVSIGLRSRFRALNRYSRALPLINTPSDDVSVVGQTFESSVESGVVSGIMFEIGGYLSLYPDNMVVFTGGDAIYFAKRIKNSIFVVCNLVLMGLALIADENVVKDN